MFGSGASGGAGGTGSGFGVSQASTTGGFGGPSAAIPSKGMSTFGTAPSSSGFGAGGATTTGQFAIGNNTGTNPGFGRNSATGTTPGFGGTGTTGTTPGFGGTGTAGTTPGFGVTGTAGTTPGFGGTGTAGTTSGFGVTGTAGTTPGFGGTGTAGTTSGFGVTGTAGTTPGFGGTGTAGTTPGFGVTGAVGTNLGFGGSGNKGFGTGLGIGAQTQVPQYKGIKGPGFSTDWASGVNFSTLRDDTIFEDLPLPLQNHLTELHNFIQSEHDAKKFVKVFLSDAVTGINNNASNYRELQKKLGQLTSGENAVDTVRVDCYEREIHSQQLGKVLESFEDEVSQYTKHVWEPLADKDVTQWRANNRLEPPSEPFQRSLKDIQSRMQDIAASVEELELALLPGSRQKKYVTGTFLDENGGGVNAATEPFSSTLPFAPSTLAGGLEPLDATSSMRVTGPPHPVAQMNTSLHNELTALLNLAAWSSRLHSRADGARDLFAHLYGASESELLLTQQHQQLSSGPKRPFPPSRDTMTPNKTEYETLGDIHRRLIGLPRLSNTHGEDRRMQYDVLLERQQQSNLPTVSSGILKQGPTRAGATAAAGVGGFGAGAPAAPAAAGFGAKAPAAAAAPAGAAVGGFGAGATAPAAAPAGAGVGGFGAKAPAAAAAGVAVGGFGAGATAAPAGAGVGGFGAGATAPAAAPAGAAVGGFVAGKHAGPLSDQGDARKDLKKTRS